MASVLTSDTKQVAQRKEIYSSPMCNISSFVLQTQGPDDASGYKTIFEYECFSFWNASLSGAARSYPSRRIQTCSCLSCFWCLPFWKCQVGSSVILCQVVKKQPTYRTGTDHRHKRVRFNFQTVSIPNICCVWILFLLVQPEATGQDKSKPVTVYQASGVSLC